MTDSNLVRLTYGDEQTWENPPATPVMRLLRYTGEDFSWEADTRQSAEITSSGQITDVIETMRRVRGGYRFELSFGEHDEFIAGALKSSWLNTPVLDNDGVADSVVTAVDDATDTYTVASAGASFIAGHLVLASGFTNANNNRVFAVASSTATTVVAAGTPTLTNETAPPGTAKLKVVGFVGATGDITATANGLASTLLNFTTLGLRVGQTVKIGGNATGDKFATAPLNDWACISAIAANALTLYNLPTGWTTDTGTGKTIKVWFGDVLQNAQQRRSWYIEKGFMGQDIPLYIPMYGLMSDTLSMTLRAGEIITGAITVLGSRAGTGSTTSLDADPLPSKTGEIMNAIANVGRISEAGTPVEGVLELSFELNNGLREQTAVAKAGLYKIGLGDFVATGTLSLYFANATQYNKTINGTATSLFTVVEKQTTAYAIQFPRVKLFGPTPSAGGRNQDVTLDCEFTALQDTALTNKTMLIDRLNYYEES